MTAIKFSKIPSLAPPRTPRQQKQWHLFRAIGSVSGIRGYLINLEHSIINAVISETWVLIVKEDIKRLNGTLRYIETSLRNEMAHLKETAPPKVRKKRTKIRPPSLPPL